jgi:hypothetical protein
MAGVERTANVKKFSSQECIHLSTFHATGRQSFQHRETEM